jgi:hypothetical protein
MESIKQQKNLEKIAMIILAKGKEVDARGVGSSRPTSKS